MLRSFSLALLALCAATQAGANCTCRYQGGDVTEGATACIATPTGNTLARCGKSLNVTSWIPLNTPCTPDSISTTTQRPASKSAMRAHKLGPAATGSAETVGGENVAINPASSASLTAVIASFRLNH